MRISDNEVKKILGTVGHAHEHELDEIRDLKNRTESEASTKEDDGTMIKQVVQNVLDMPDREEMIAELKAKIESGQYNPTGDEIADAMIRRSIADKVR